MCSLQIRYKLLSLADNKHSMNVTVYPDYRQLVTQTLLLIATTSASQIRLPSALKESQSSKMLNYTILFIKDYMAIKFAFHHYESAYEASTLCFPILKAYSNWIKMDCFVWTQITVQTLLYSGFEKYGLLINAQKDARLLNLHCCQLFIITEKQYCSMSLLVNQIFENNIQRKRLQVKSCH